MFIETKSTKIFIPNKHNRSRTYVVSWIAMYTCSLNLLQTCVWLFYIRIRTHSSLFTYRYRYKNWLWLVVFVIINVLLKWCVSLLRVCVYTFNYLTEVMSYRYRYVIFGGFSLCRIVKYFSFNRVISRLINCKQIESSASSFFALLSFCFW